MNDIAAITCFFNFEKDDDKLKSFIKFKETIEGQNVPLFVIEVIAEGSNPTLRTICDEGKHVTGKTILPILIRGNALNVLSSRVPKEYKNIAWLNYDTIIKNESWAEEASHLLKDYKLVKVGKDSDYESPMVVKRNFFELVGMFDYDFCGNSNLLTFLCAENSDLLYSHKDLLDLYEKNNLEIFYRILSYRKSCYDYFKGNIGYLDSTIEHLSHDAYSLEESIGLLSNIDVDYNIHHNELHDLIALKNIFGLKYPPELLNLLKKV